MGGRPGRRTLLAVLVTPLLVVTVLAGCGGGAPAPPTSAPPPTPTGTPQEQALAWTSAVCTALLPVSTQITAAPRFDVNAPVATRDAYSAYLAESLALTDRAREQLAAAGPAPVPSGDVIAEQVRGDVADLRANLVDAKSQVDRVDPNNPVAIGSTVIGIARVVRALLNGAAVVRTINAEPTLAAAYAQAPSCQELQRAGGPPPTTRVTPLPPPPTR